MCVLSTDTLNKFPLLYQTNLDPTFQASASLYMPYQGLGEMFEGDSADMSAEKFPLVSLWAERLACADPGARTPIGASEFFCSLSNLKISGEQIFIWFG